MEIDVHAMIFLRYKSFKLNRFDQIYSLVLYKMKAHMNNFKFNTYV